MASLREQMREQTRFKRMRQGQEVPEYIDVPSMPEIRVALVPLTEAEETRSQVASAQLDLPDTMAGFRLRDRSLLQHNVWQSMRDPADLSKPLYESVEAMVEELEPYDLEYLGLQLFTLMDYASPAIDKVSEQELDGLKKASNEINWNELTGKRWAAVKVYLSILSPELLRDKSRFTTFTESLTETSENEESTFAASPN